MGETTITQLVMLLLVLLSTQPIQLGLCNGATTQGCIQIERTALLEFKHGLKDPTNRLSSWVGQDCCTWKGVACNNRSGHVDRLDLRNPHSFDDDYPDAYTDDLPYNRWSLEGEMSDSLLGLKHLTYLDLSMNYFGGIRIPQFMCSFKRLRYLNLSRAGFGGPIPPQLGNLSTLQYLLKIKLAN